MIVVNGEVVAQGSQFSLDDIEVVTATVDLEEVRSHRYAPSRSLQAVRSIQYQRIETALKLSIDDNGSNVFLSPSLPKKIRYHAPEEEIALGPGKPLMYSFPSFEHYCGPMTFLNEYLTLSFCPACFLWDYLRRSKLAGYIVPLSGGIDSCATAVIVFSMCRLVLQAMKAGNKQVMADVQRIAGQYESDGWLPKTPQELCHNIFHTLYLGMATQSSKETRSRAKELSKSIGAYYIDVSNSAK